MVRSVYSQFSHNQIHTPSLASPYTHAVTHGLDLGDVGKAHPHTQDHTL